MQNAESEWRDDGSKLEAAIAELDYPNKTYEALDEAAMEARLLRLKSIARVFQRERELAYEWHLEHERLNQAART